MTINSRHEIYSYCRYGTNDRRIIVASVDWGPWGAGDESKGKSRLRGAPKPPKPESEILDMSEHFTCNWKDYATAATNTMVIGRMLSFLAKKVESDMTFCIGHSLGGHICGFAGKEYRREELYLSIQIRRNS